MTEIVELDVCDWRGQPAAADYAMIRDAGFVLENADGAPVDVPTTAPDAYPRAPLPMPVVS